MKKKKNKKKISDYFKKGALGFKILLLTLVFAFIIITVLSSFILVEGASIILGIVLVTIIGSIYLFVLLIYIWDWLKINYQDNSND